MKKEYKEIKSKERRQRHEFRERVALINLIINAKSWRLDPRYFYLEKDIRRQLRYLLGRNKTWDGDVKEFFLRSHGAVEPKRWVSEFGSRYRTPKERETEEIDIPF